MTGLKQRLAPTRRFNLSEDLELVVYGADSSGFESMRIVDEDGNFMPVTMTELLNAISAAYYCQKDKKKR